MRSNPSPSVHLIFFLGAAQSIMVMVDCFEWFVYDFGNYENLRMFKLSSIDSPILNGVIIFLVQLVYCWRIWVLSKWRVLPGVIAFVGEEISFPCDTQAD